MSDLKSLRELRLSIKKKEVFASSTKNEEIYKKELNLDSLY